MLEKGWELISATIRLDEPTPLAQYLGCGHTMKDMEPSRFAQKTGWLNGLTRSLSGAEMPTDAAGGRAVPKSGVLRPAEATSATKKQP